MGNLQWWTSDADLEALCKQFGEVVNIQTFEEKGSGKSKGYMLVEFDCAKSANLCKQSINGYCKCALACHPIDRLLQIHFVHQQGRDKRKEVCGNLSLKHHWAIQGLDLHLFQYGRIEAAHSSKAVPACYRARTECRTGETQEARAAAVGLEEAGTAGLALE